MTQGELGTITAAILGGLAGIGGVLRWGILQITGVIERNSATLMKFVESAARLEVKLDQAHAASIATADAVQEVADEVSGVHGSTDPKPWSKQTPPGGYTIHKHKGRP
jgi:hypothetical protein